MMSSISLIGASTFFLSDRYFKKILKPLVALSAGSLLGASFFHLIPESIETINNTLLTFVLVFLGFLSFFILEQFLFWHHCHEAPSEHHTHRKVLRAMIMVSDSIHNFIGGVAVGASFMVSPKIGLITWLSEALHEIPQELGDFGVLVHTGWTKRKALFFNFLSGLTFLLGGFVAFALSFHIDIIYFLPFSAGNFIYLATVDLVPEINRHERLSHSIVHFLAFVAGTGVLLGIRVVFD